MMNWIKLSTFPTTFVIRLALLFSVFAFFVHTGTADDFLIDKTGLLTVGSEDTPATLALDTDRLDTLILEQEAPDDETKPKTGLLDIKIEKEGILEILSDTDVGLGGSYLSVKGTLIVNLDADDGLYGFKEEKKDDVVTKTPQTLNITLDGGLIDIQAVVDGDITADFDADITLGASGGTIDIASGLTYETGKISGNTGDFTKKGEGKYIVDTVKIGGTFVIESGDVHFSNDATVGKLMNGDADTIISGQRDDDPATTDKVEGNSTLSIAKGGEIKGTLEDFSYLLVGDGSTTVTLKLESDVEHTKIGTIGIQKNATLDLQAGSIQLASDDPVVPPDPDEDEEEDEEETEAVSYGDVIVEGTLKVSDKSGGIFKGESTDSTGFDITLAGNLDSEAKEVLNGILEIYRSDSESEIPEAIDASNMNTQIIGLGKVSVESGITFESGAIKFGTGGQKNVTGAHLFVDGGGIFQAAEIDLGTGYLLVQEEGTTMEFLETAKAGVLSTEEGTKVIAHGNAEFIEVSIAGDYDGGGNSLSIEKGGQITGRISGVTNLDLGKGDLLLQVNSETSEVRALTSTPVISADSLTIDEGTRIRMVGMESGSYSQVFKITDEDSREELRSALQEVQTALYRPTAKVNSEDSNYIDLELSVLSVDEYVDSVWHRRGGNINNAATLMEDLAALDSRYSIYYEGLTEAELQSVLRNMVSGELAGNALQMALRPPAQSVFRHLDNVAPLRSPFSRSNYRGQIREGFNVWFNPFGQTEKAESDGYAADGYDLTRYGFHLGGDIELYNRAVLGALFSYTNPQLKSELGKVSANDYTTGLYFRVPTAWAVVANMMIGFGNQDYTYKNAVGDSEYRGGSFFASAELTRPVTFQTFQLTPLIALDFQSAEMDDFIIRDNAFGGIVVEPGDVSQTALRIGMLGNAGRFRTRLQYTRQLAGDDYVLSRTSPAGNLAAVRFARSLQWGKDWINVGVGGELLTTRYFRIFADYNFDVGKHTTSHMGSLNTVLTW